MGKNEGGYLYIDAIVSLLLISLLAGAIASAAKPAGMAVSGIEKSIGQLIEGENKYHIENEPLFP